MKYGYKIAAIAAGAVLALTGASVALAQANAQMSVGINANGKANVTGVVQSVASSSLTIKSWGGTWTVNVTGTTNVNPHVGAVNDLSNVKVGDTVSVQGTAASDSLTLTATSINDPAMTKMLNKERQDNQKAIRDLRPKNLFSGLVSGVAGASFTLTPNKGAALTVNTNASTTFENNNFLTLSGITALTAGDRAQVYGARASTTVTAQIVRDLSLH
jgi:hypothetical protein